MRQKLRVRSTIVKLFFVMFVAVIGIDTLPLGISSDSGAFSFIYKMKSTIRPALRPIGLWQSEWRLFAPDPVINNCWWTIEVRGELAGELQDDLSSTTLPGSESNSLSWNSPFWGDVKPTEKFFKRRHIAYYRRLSEFPTEVLEDFADEWVRERFGSRLHAIGNIAMKNGLLEPATANTDVDSSPYVLELSLFRNELKMAPRDDDTLPTREETTWLSVTEKYLQRRYGK